MTIAEVIEEARRLGATFTLSPTGNVNLRAPSPLPNELMAQMKSQKKQLVELLTKQDSDAVIGDNLSDKHIADEMCQKSASLGITVADVLRIFPGARIVEQLIDEPKPATCPHCDKETIPLWRRGGKIIQRTDADSNRYWACHYCGRPCKAKRIKTAGRETKRQ